MHYNRNAHNFFAIKLSVPFGIKQYLLNKKKYKFIKFFNKLKKTENPFVPVFLKFGGTCTAFVYYTYTGYLF